MAQLSGEDTHHASANASPHIKHNTSALQHHMLSGRGVSVPCFGIPCQRVVSIQKHYRMLCQYTSTTEYSINTGASPSVKSIQKHHRVLYQYRSTTECYISTEAPQSVVSIQKHHRVLYQYRSTTECEPTQHAGSNTDLQAPL